MIRKRATHLCEQYPTIKWGVIVVIWTLLEGVILYSQLDYIHDTPIGGLIFKDGQVYNLCVIDGLDIKVTTRGNK